MPGAGEAVAGADGAGTADGAGAAAVTSGAVAGPAAGGVRSEQALDKAIIPSNTIFFITRILQQVRPAQEYTGSL